MRRQFILLYAASGAAALVYEVAWTRLLTLQMGHTVAAASTVLAAFMGGLAAGAWIVGRLTRTVDDAHRLRAYALLEIAVAAIAIALPALLTACVPVLRWAYADGTAPMRFALVRVASSLALIGIPAGAMGATFPIAAAWFASQSRRQQRDAATRVEWSTAGDVGALYAANTAGAALGALAAGFWLIPALGLRGATWIGVALNGVAAAGAFWLSRTDTHSQAARSVSEIRAPGGEIVHTSRPAVQSAEKRSKRKADPKVRSVARAPAPRPGLASAAAAISGFVALVYEVAWTRVLALVIGPTTYAFATMVASFVGGLAIGSAAGARIARRSSQPAAWLAAMLVVTAATASAAAWFAASRLPLIVASQVSDPDAAFGRIVIRQAAAVALLLLPMTFSLGAAFPLALAVASAGAGTVGRDTARVYACNTLGAVAGALAGGFALLPFLGLQTTFRVASIVGIVAGAGVWIGAKASRNALGTLAIACAAVVVFAVPRWDRMLLASGAYKYSPYMASGDLEAMLRAGRLEYYKEGAASTVSVRRLAGTLSLAIDGKIDASNAGDMLTQRLLGLLPVVLHDDPQDVCIIGLGSGVTLDSALDPSRTRRADVVEISPEVVEASRFFERENGKALQAPGVRLIVGDGRSHLLLTTRQYDVIVSEPSNPWMAGVAALFTREFFEAARARLKPDGLLCQWAHAYDISQEDLRSIVRTFASVFPQGTLWLVGEGDLLLIGTAGPAIEPHLDRIPQEARRDHASRLLASLIAPTPTFPHAVAATPFQLLSLYGGGPGELARFGGAAPIQTDDRMALEFSAPRGIYGRSSNDNMKTIRALADAGALPSAVREAYETANDASWTARGAMELKAEAYAIAYDDFRRAVTINNRNAAALRGLSEAAAGAQRQIEARAYLQSLAASQPGHADVRIELSRVLASTGDFDAAVVAATEAMQQAPGDPRPAEQLASILADAGDAGRLAPLAESLLARFPERDEARYYRATALFLSGRANEAAVEAQRVIASNPHHARAYNLLGAACATAERRDCAQTAFEASLEANPREPGTYVNLGLLHLQSGKSAIAATYFAEALTIDPTSAAARDGLSQARAALAKP